MCGDEADATRGLIVRATFDGSGWVVVVVARPRSEGAAARATVLRVDLDLQVTAMALWRAIAEAAAAVGIDLPVVAIGPPESPGAGVRLWGETAAPLPRGP